MDRKTLKALLLLKGFLRNTNTYGIDDSFFVPSKDGLFGVMIVTFHKWQIEVLHVTKGPNEGLHGSSTLRRNFLRSKSALKHINRITDGQRETDRGTTTARL